MIQVHGEVTLYYKTNKISMDLINRRLNDSLHWYTVLSHVIHQDSHKLHIEFMMNMNASRNYKSIEDCLSYVQPELKRELPFEVTFGTLTTHKIIKNYQEIKPMKDYMVRYIDKLDKSSNN